MESVIGNKLKLNRGNQTNRLSTSHPLHLKGNKIEAKPEPRTKPPHVNVEKQSAAPKERSGFLPVDDADFVAPDPVVNIKRRNDDAVQSEDPIQNKKKPKKPLSNPTVVPPPPVTKRTRVSKPPATNPSKKLKDVPNLLTRTSPQILFHTLHSLSNQQKEYVRSIGFGDMLDITVDGIPSHVGHYVITNFDEQNMLLNVDRGQLHVTKNVVRRLLGLPSGTIDINNMEQRPPTDATVQQWKDQFKLENDIRPKGVQKAILKPREVDLMFKVNFFMLICNTLGQTISMGTCDQTPLRCVTENFELDNIDWCAYIIQCLKDSITQWRATSQTGYFVGPITLLSLLYLEGVAFDPLPLYRGIPVICYWNSVTMRFREEMEYETVGFGTGELRHSFTHPDVVQKDIADTKTVDDLIQSIATLFSKITIAKDFLQNKIKSAIETFPDDLDLPEYQQKFNDMFQPDDPHSDTQYSQPEYPDVDLNANTDPDEQPLSQWWYQTPNQIALDNAMILAASRSRSKSNSDPSIPNFSLNLSQAFEGLSTDNAPVSHAEETTPLTPIPLSVVPSPVSHAEETTPLTPIPLSVVPSPVVPPNPNPVTKRQITKSLVQRSPFVERTVDMIKAVTPHERSISEWMFALQANPSEVVFKTFGDIMAQRYHMESFFPGCEIFGHLIDIWSILLNAQEELRSPDSSLRVFCKTNVTGSYLQNTSIGDPEKEPLFHSHLVQSIQDTDHILGTVRLVFLPVIHVRHIFTLVIDVRDPSVVILDNIKDDPDIPTKYGLIPELVVKYMASYMRTVNHANAERMAQVIPHRLDMDWRTINNHTDCGIFTMRHMETYMGPKIFNTGFKKESKAQQNQLDKMRLKYVTRILSYEHNFLKGHIEAAAAEFQTVGLRKRGSIRADAAKNIHARLARFG